MMHTFKLYTYIKTTIILRQKKIISTIKIQNDSLSYNVLISS